MKPVFEKLEDRRAFLKSAARYTLLGGALALAYALSVRKAGSPSACIKNGLCHNCAVLRDCSLPQAQTTRAQST